MDREVELKKIEEEVLNLPDKFSLVEERKLNNYLPVVGEGRSDAEIIFIGEAPGANEAKSGKPFCGRAGKVLDSLLEDVGIKREEVFITSIVKDRPPKNRDPRPDEIALYAPFLDRQIKIIKPEVIATLGRFSMEYVMRRYGLELDLGSISQIHGKIFDSELDGQNIKVIPLYHPAAAIYNQHLMDTLKQDFQALKTI